MNYDQLKDCYRSFNNDEVEVVPYSDIINYDLSDLFSRNKNKFVIYYPLRSDFGHFVCVMKNDKDKTIYFYDPLGMKPDEIKSYAPKFLYKGEDVNSLIKYFIEYYDNKWIVDYNDYKHQKSGSRVKTCGLHCIFRLSNSNLSNDDYNDLLDEIEKKMKIKSKDKYKDRLIIELLSKLIH